MTGVRSALVAIIVTIGLTAFGIQSQSVPLIATPLAHAGGESSVRDAFQRMGTDQPSARLGGRAVTRTAILATWCRWNISVSTFQDRQRNRRATTE
jgi:hypothetical protein